MLGCLLRRCSCNLSLDRSVLDWFMLDSFILELNFRGFATGAPEINPHSLAGPISCSPVVDWTLEEAAGIKVYRERER